MAEASNANVCLEYALLQRYIASSSSSDIHDVVVWNTWLVMHWWNVGMAGNH